MTKKEKIEIFIKMTLEPVEDKPGYVWINKRNFQIISIETLQKTLLKYYEEKNEEEE